MMKDEDQTTMEDVEMKDEIDQESKNYLYKDSVLDDDKLLGLLEASNKAAHLIAGKHVLLEVGGTGAGKTTSALYLAGATFEEEDVDGFTHYKPLTIPNESLSKFAVSGGANSVTTTIQTTKVTVDNDGQQETITICDTPGFGDTKGPEMEISNNLGIISALKLAASIKLVIVLDYSTMAGERWCALRKNLSTIIAMMGHRPKIDFSSFEYIFTRCEGKNRKRISKQLSGFLNAVQQDPNIDNKPLLIKLLTDMISKTKPDEVICIDPEESEDAQDTLNQLWRGPRITNPAETFVNFCSKESLAVLSEQVNVLLHNLGISLEELNLDSAEKYLRKMLRLAESLSLSKVDEAFQEGTTKVTKFVDEILSDIKNLLVNVDNQFEQTLNGTILKLSLLLKTSDIRNISKMDFDCNQFIAEITDNLFSVAKQPLTGVDPAVEGSDICVQQSIVRFGLLVNSIRGFVSDIKIEEEYSTMIQATEELMHPLLTVLNDRLNENVPSSTILKGCLPQLNFVLSMKDFFRTKEFADLELDIARWTSFETDFKNVLDKIIDAVKNYVTSLVKFDKILHEELLGHKAWSYSSIYKLNGIDYYRECRNFLLAVSSSESLAASIFNDASYNAAIIIRDFDDAVNRFVPQLVLFLQGESSRTVFDNETGAMHDRVTEAKNMNGHIVSLVVAANVLKDLDCIEYQMMLDTLNGLKIKLSHFVAESKKEPVRRSHNIIRGKRLEPTEEELKETHSKQALNGLRGWYIKCNELKVYRMKHGHCNVPQRYPGLGEWVQKQRKEKKKYETGSKTAMTYTKLQHLEDLDFEWNPKDATWNQRFEELKKYREDNDGNFPKMRESKLGMWTHHQRNSNKTRAGHTEERKAKLRKLGSFHY